MLLTLVQKYLNIYFHCFIEHFIVNDSFGSTINKATNCLHHLIEIVCQDDVFMCSATQLNHSFLCQNFASLWCFRLVRECAEKKFLNVSKGILSTKLCCTPESFCVNANNQRGRENGKRENATLKKFLNA